MAAWSDAMAMRTACTRVAIEESAWVPLRRDARQRPVPLGAEEATTRNPAAAQKESPGVSTGAFPRRPIGGASRVSVLCWPLNGQRTGGFLYWSRKDLILRL